MTKIHVPNPDVLRAGIRHIEDNPAEWHQDFWVATAEQRELPKGVCGTAGCLAAHILLAQGRTWDDLLDIVHGVNGQQRSNLADLALAELGFGEMRPKYNGGNVINILWPDDENEDEDGTTDADRFENQVFGYTYDRYRMRDIAGTVEMLEVLKDRIGQVTDVDLYHQDQSDIRRIFRQDLQGLDRTGRECEVCHGHVPNHEWADMDVNGFIVNCPHRGYVFEV